MQKNESLLGDHLTGKERATQLTIRLAGVVLPLAYVYPGVASCAGRLRTAEHIDCHPMVRLMPTSNRENVLHAECEGCGIIKRGSISPEWAMNRVKLHLKNTDEVYRRSEVSKSRTT